LSAGSREILGIGPDEPVTIQRLIAAVHPGDRDRWKSAMEGLLDPEGPGEVRVDFRSTRPPFRWLTATGRAFFDGLTPVRVLGSLLEPTVLNEVCQRVVEEAARDYPEHWIHFERWDDSPGDWDTDLLTLVARNLIRNAVAHSDTGAPIVVSAVNCVDQALLVVANLGEPLPERIRQHLLDPEHHDLERGACPDLCETLEVVRAHGGRLDLSSQYDSTVFHVWLPRVRPSSRVGARS
jgi:hypothetical protein